MRSHFPPLEDLSTSVKKWIMAGSPCNLHIEKMWMDDRLFCLDLRFGDSRFSVWWLRMNEAAAFYYPDSPTARQTILEVIKREAKP